MDFFQYTHKWIQGEMFESICIATGGALLLVLALLALIYGSSPHASSLTIPFSVTGLILILGSIVMYSGNVKRMTTFPEQYKSNPNTFVTAEKARVETFDNMYRSARIITLVALVIGLSMAYFLKNPHVKSIGLALIILGISTVFIDHFSKERAAKYYNHIQEYLNS